jgi:hypothetical protein
MSIAWHYSPASAAPQAFEQSGLSCPRGSKYEDPYALIRTRITEHKDTFVGDFVDVLLNWIFKSPRDFFGSPHAQIVHTLLTIGPKRSLSNSHAMRGWPSNLSSQ